MSLEVSTAKHAIHDKLESEIEAAKAKLDTLKARAEVAKANVEIRAIAELAVQRLDIHEKLQELKRLGDDKWGQAKKDIEARLAGLERSIKGIEAKVKAH
jgi:chromosome segregation ATPase